MKYPQLNSWLLYKRLDKNNYEVKNCRTGNFYEFGIDEIKFLNQLDGKTNPYSIDTPMSELEVRKLLRFLKREKLIRYSRVEKSFLSLQISLFKIKCSERGRKIAFALNFLLMISFLPVFVFGLSFLFNNSTQLNIQGFEIITGSIFGMLVGLLLHEVGHALAAAGYKAHLFEAGLIVGLMSGAYVALDYDNIKKRFRRIQILAAGIEINLFLAGVSCIFSILIYSMSSFFFAIAWANFALAVINMLCISGVDGASIIEELIGTKNIMFNAVDFVFDKNLRSNLVKQGDITGCVKIASSFIGAVCQLAYPLLIIINILGVISCFT